MTAIAAPVSTGAFRVEIEGDLAIVWFDLPGEKVNKFSSTVMQEFAAVVEGFEKNSSIRRIIVASGKPSIIHLKIDPEAITPATTLSAIRQKSLASKR